MKTLREFAQFVGKPNNPISPRALLDYLKLGISPNPLSLRELTSAFDNALVPASIESVSVAPTTGIVPFQIGMQVTGTKGFFLEIRWRVLRNGQQVAVYPNVLGQVAHTFSEPGTYTVEATFKGIGSTGYAEVSKSVTVVAQPQPTPPPPPTPSTWRLSLRLAPVELVLSTLRIISAEWKVTPLWNPSQVFNLTGSDADNRYTAEVTLPNPPSSAADSRVQVELKFRCAVAGVIDGVVFPSGQFDGIVNPAFIGWENKSLKAGWSGQYEIVKDPNTGIAKVNVAALFQGAEPL
ncbi:hypothetical protein HC928_04070 [bacterium]|nr:hypothetical protein [bacterium]